MEEKKKSAGILPVCTVTKRICLVRRGPNEHFPNTWATFGGMYEEEDATMKNNAIREFEAETSYYGPIQISDKPWYINDDNHTVFYNFIGLFAEEFVPDLEAAGAGVDYGWFQLDKLPENLIPGLRESLDKKGYVIENIIRS